MLELQTVLKAARSTDRPAAAYHLYRRALTLVSREQNPTLWAALQGPTLRSRIVARCMRGRKTRRRPEIAKVGEPRVGSDRTFLSHHVAADVMRAAMVAFGSNSVDFVAGRRTTDFGATSPPGPVLVYDRSHPSRPFAAVVAKGSFGSLRAEGFPPTLPVNLYNQESHVLSAAMCAMSESR